MHQESLMKSIVPDPADGRRQSLADSGDGTPNCHDLNYAQLIMCAAAIGIAGGLAATAYYYLLENLTHLVWHTFPEMLQFQFSGDFLTHDFLVNNYVWIATTIGGLVVGLSLYLCLIAI